jgi:hypothetical protein
MKVVGFGQALRGVAIPRHAGPVTTDPDYNRNREKV